MNHNSFTDASADAFIDTLQHNTSLEELWLYNNNFSDDKKAAIKAACGGRVYITISSSSESEYSDSSSESDDSDSEIEISSSPESEYSDSGSESDDSDSE